MDGVRFIVDRLSPEKTYGSEHQAEGRCDSVVVMNKELEQDDE
jgi:hypothetical protein